MARGKKEYSYAAIDCETDPFDGLTYVKPFIWGFFDGTIYKEFKTAAQIVDYLRDKELIVYAHNGGKFDYHFMLEYLDEMQEIMIINGRIAKFKIGKCEYRDSYNIIPVPLSVWQKDDFDYTILHKDFRDIPENRAKIQKYLKSDCVNLFEMVTSFINEYGLHLTQASASIKIWQEMSGVEAPRSTSSHYEFFTPYYYGGRVECFETGFKKVDFKMIDINSAYPAAMLKKHPLSTTFSELTDLTIKDVKKLLKTESGLAGFYHIKSKAFGCFPYRGPDGSLYFPNDDDTRIYHVTGWEILAALDTKACEIEEIYTAYIFDTLISFEDYILHFYELKKAGKLSGNKADELFAKLLMNSLYGKFAANPENYKKYMNLRADCAGAIGQEITDELESLFDGDEALIKKYDLSAWHYSGPMGPWALAARNLDENEQTYYNIATSASITGCVRAFMWRTLCQCEGLIYCDTDSIAAEKFAPEIKMSNELGDWDTDGEFTEYAIGGKKMYSFKYIEKYVKQNTKTGEMMLHKTASKGVQINADEIKQVALGNEVLFKPQAPSYTIHKQPTFVNRRVNKTSKSLKDVEARDVIKTKETVLKNIKKFAKSVN